MIARTLSSRGRAPAAWIPEVIRLVRGAVTRFGMLVLLVVLWQWATVSAANPFFPSPRVIAERIHHDWFSGAPWKLWTTHSFRTEILPSIGRMLAGWVLAALIGTVVGIVAGSSRRARMLIDPPVQFLRALPTPAVVPVFLILFGATTVMRVLLIAFGCVWPVLLNAMQGTAAIDPQAVETARTLRLGRSTQLLRVTLPFATPSIAAGMRISLALALVLMVLSEWVVSTTGLGFALIDAQRHFDLPGMWAAMVLLGAVGYVLNSAFMAGEGRILRWHKQSREQE